MTTSEDVRPHLTDARIKANATYQRRRARTAADTLLEIDPSLWDEQTLRIILETLPRLAGPVTPAVERLIDELLPAVPGGWCEYASESGPCTLTAGHRGDHDPDPFALPDHDNGDYRA